MSALGRARDLSSRIALVTYGAIAAGCSAIQRTVRARHRAAQLSHHGQDASDCVRELRARGIEVVVAPGLVTDLADSCRHARRVSVLGRTPSAKRSTMPSKWFALARIEAARARTPEHDSGSTARWRVAVDMDERIETLNPAMERVLERASAQSSSGASSATSRLNCRCCDTLRELRVEIDELQRFGSRALARRAACRIDRARRADRRRAHLSGSRTSIAARRSYICATRRHRPAAVVRYRLSDLVGHQSCASAGAAAGGAVRAQRCAPC